MIVKLLTEHHLKFVSLEGGCRGSSESTHVKMPHCWKSHVTALNLVNGIHKRQYVISKYYSHRYQLILKAMCKFYRQ